MGGSDRSSRRCRSVSQGLDSTPMTVRWDGRPCHGPDDLELPTLGNTNGSSTSAPTKISATHPAEIERSYYMTRHTDEQPMSGRQSGCSSDPRSRDNTLSWWPRHHRRLRTSWPDPRWLGESVCRIEADASGGDLEGGFDAEKGRPSAARMCSAKRLIRVVPAEGPAPRVS